MQAGLVGERARADVGLAAVGRHVGHLADGVGQAHGVAQPLRRDDLATGLQLQVADDGEQVGVAGALAVAVDRALHVRGTDVEGGHRVGHRAAGVVVAVDAEPGPRGLQDVADDVLHLGRQHAAVGVAERHDLGPGLGRDAYRLEGVAAVRGIPVEEVLRIEEHASAVSGEEAHRVADHREVLLVGGPQRLLHVAHVRLGDEGDHRGAGVEQGAHERVGLGLAARPPGRAERGQRGRLQVELVPGPGEELRVLGVRPRPAALDEPDSQLVQVPRDDELVGDREVEALLLGTVAQRRVVDLDGLGGAAAHGRFSVVGLVEPGLRGPDGPAGRWSPLAARVRTGWARDTKRPPGLREVCATRGARRAS